MKVSAILDNIDAKQIALPEFQRGYVWNREQVRGLMDSLYRKHPVGGLLVWVTSSDAAKFRGEDSGAPGTVKLLLDGQQRITSLYGIIRGSAPSFFKGDPRSFLELYFNIQDEVFEFYGPVKMRDNPYWISVTDLMQKGVGEFIKKMIGDPVFADNIQTYIDRLNAVEGIKNIDLYIEEVTGSEKTVDIVVDIFNRVNSGGTKLSKGDLALARLCVAWPEARESMETMLKKWNSAGFTFQLEWLLRCITTVTTGDAYFTSLKDISADAFRDGLNKTGKYVNFMLNLIASRLGLDHDRVLGSRYSIPLLIRYLHGRGGTLSDHKEMDRLLFWYVHTFLWGRYAGSTESVLNRDLYLIDHDDGDPLENIIEELRRQRGDLTIKPGDFTGWSRSARFYPLLYMLTRVHHARDFCSGNPLHNQLLGKENALQVHHLFPKAKLYKCGFVKTQVNAIANFSFLTAECNQKISDQEPEFYFPWVEEHQPGALASHWIPTDPLLWRIDNYLDFLSERRKLLAKAANELLDGLAEGKKAYATTEGDITDRTVVVVPGSIDGDEEEALLNEVNGWVANHSLPLGEQGFELIEPATGKLLATIDLAWPDGIQKGLSQPVALILDEGEEVEHLLNKYGYRFFTSVPEFRNYVTKELINANGNSDLSEQQ